MTELRSSRHGVLANWYWIWLVSAFFVGAMVVYFLMDHPAWYRASYRGISLSHEMSYAVWWSGICLFLAGLIFARVAELAAGAGRATWPWLVMALAMLALCFDEVGSLHEVVSRIAGWSGLLVFAAIFGVAFGLALFNVCKRPELRIVVLIVIISLAIFVGVAGLELVEHKMRGVHHLYRKIRLIGEEGIELLAMGLLITAGLIAMARMGDDDRRFLNAASVVDRLLDYPVTVFFLFVAQIIAAEAFIVPNYTFFPEGIPSVLFPMLMFFSLGIMAQLRVSDSIVAGYWRWMALILIATSAMQMYNLNTLVNQVVGVPANIMTGPPLSWMATMIPLILLAWQGLRSNALGLRDIIHPLTVLLLAYLLLYPDLQFSHRIEYHYFAFSSVVAYSCYQLMARIPR